MFGDKALPTRPVAICSAAGLIFLIFDYFQSWGRIFFVCVEIKQQYMHKKFLVCWMLWYGAIIGGLICWQERILIHIFV